jgi:PAS domain S-box-containing protein
MEYAMQQLVRPDGELLYEAFNASPIGIALESHKGRTLLVNPALCSMLGFSEDELRGKHWCDFSPAEDVAKYRTYFDELLAGLRNHYQVEKRFHRRDGSLIWGRVSVFLLNSQPAPVAVAMIEDITEHKAEEELRRSQARLATEVEVLAKLDEWSSRLWRTGSLQEGLNEMLVAVISLLNADKASVQLFDSERGMLITAADRGFEEPYRDSSREVSITAQSACAGSVRSGQRIIIEDVETDPAYAALRPIARAGGFRAVTSTPLVGSDGVVVGVLSTHFKSPHRPTEECLHRLDLYARQATGFILHCQAKRAMSERYSATSEQLHLAMEAGGIGGYEWDIKNGRLFWFGAKRDLLGPEGSASSDQIFWDHVHPDDRDRLRQLAQKAMEKHEELNMEFRVIWPDGTEHWLRSKTQFHYGADGRPERMLGMSVDVTEEKQRQQALRESEEKFRSVFRDAGVGMVIVSPEGRFLTANRSFCEYLGYTEEELHGMSVKAITAPEDWPVFSRKLAEVVRGERAMLRFEKRCKHKSGRIVHTQSSAILIRNSDGTPKYFVGEVLDVTKRKEAEEVLSSVSRKLIEAQEQERARIARELHDDIGQRLSILAVELDQMQQLDPALPPEVLTQLRELQKRTTDLTGDIQTMSHTLHSSKLNLLGLVGAMASLCKEFGTHQKMEIDFKSRDLPAVVPPEISSTLFRVLQEALQNAAKHSGVKRIEVRLNGAGDEIHLIVKDLGKGFDPFTAMRGVGLGLTSMQERVRLLDGTIDIQSQPMAGTTIHVRVRVKLEKLAQRAAG